MRWQAYPEGASRSALLHANYFVLVEEGVGGIAWVRACYHHDSKEFRWGMWTGAISKGVLGSLPDSYHLTEDAAKNAAMLIVVVNDALARLKTA